jgi:conjugal transfer pilus assembly protein TraL
MEENQYVIMHKAVDSLPMVGNWEIDTMFIILSGYIFGAFFIEHAILYCVCGALFLAFLNEKRKKVAYKGFGRHLLYSLGLYKPKRRLPPSYIRFFLS